MIQFKFGQIDFNTKRDTQAVVVSSYKPWSTVNDLARDRAAIPIQLPTNEVNFTLLDGSMCEWSDNMFDNTWGVYGEDLSNSDGVYNYPTSVRLNFNDPHKSRGLTLYYYSDCGYSVRVTWYSDTAGTVLLKSGIYETTPMIGEVRESVNGFKCIDIEFIT